MIIERDYGPQESWIDGYNKWRELRDKGVINNTYKLGDLKKLLKEQGYMLKRGEIYFAKLTDNAKIRPFLIYQNNFLNKSCSENIYHTVVVLPLSGQILGGDYRVLIKKRGLMTRDSEIVATAIGIISTEKIIYSKGLITKLTDKEMQKVDEAVLKVLGVKNAI